MADTEGIAQYKLGRGSMSPGRMSAVCTCGHPESLHRGRCTCGIVRRDGEGFSDVRCECRRFRSISEARA